MTKWLAVGMTDHRPCLPKVVKFGVEIIRIIPNRPYFSGRLCTSFAAYSLLSKVPWVWYVLFFFVLLLCLVCGYSTGDPSLEVCV